MTYWKPPSAERSVSGSAERGGRSILIMAMNEAPTAQNTMVVP
jgi:hypothetical protein